MVDRMQPYDGLPNLPPDGIESTKILRQVAHSARALARLDVESQRLPDPSILINTIPYQEARSSSEIENIVTTQDDLYRAAAVDTEPDDPATREVLRYRAALKHASDHLADDALSLDRVKQVCSDLMAKDITFRGQGEFVHLRDADHNVTYTPPSGGIVLDRLLKDLERFLASETDLDPLIQMAVAHYQFEAIHPFKDGNGRTGRILNLLMLQQAGLLHIPVLYLSKYIIEHKDDYYRLLTKVTFEGAWQEWILWMLKGVEEAANATLERIERIRALIDDTGKRIQEELPHIYKHGLMDVLFKQPYCKISFLVDAGVAKRQTASEYLKELERIGILVGKKSGREMIYIHPALLDAVK